MYQKPKIKSYLLVFFLVLITSTLLACADKEENIKETISVTTPEQKSMTEPTPESVDVLDNVVDKVPVVLYFANENGYLVAQKREVPKVDGLARVTMYELAKGPEANSGLLPALPPGTKLRDINIKDGLCTVDFSAELMQNHPGGSGGELLTVYSIVNTLTQYPSVEAVQILIDGQIVETLAGHVSLNEPLKREDSMITSANP